MESTSLPNGIQVSSTTAELLQQAGYGSWVSLRKDIVHAKGKGRLQTYWCNPVVSDRCGMRDNYLTSSPSCVGWGQTSIGALPHTKHERQNHLIDYNAEVLTQLLRKVVTKRNAIKHLPKVKPVEKNDEKYSKEINRYKGKSTVMDQITEVVPFADFYPDGEDVPLEELDPIVKAQIHEFVSDVAKRYNDVPFHNFEHVSFIQLPQLSLSQRFLKGVARHVVNGQAAEPYYTAAKH